ncbi:MAG: S-layer homology domain-containing protein [Clostridia bacterium]|nr:S-layer homology domain-containing protein [Clostridia bacterium]
MIFEDDEKFSSTKSKYTYKLELDSSTYNDASSIVVQLKATDNKGEAWKSEKFKYNITGKTVTVTTSGVIGSKMSRKFGYFSNTFKDVKASQWFYPYVVTTYEYNLLLGSNGYFKPTGNITVAETIALASRLNVIYEGKTENFDQTKGTNWYDTYVDYAKKNYIITDTMFSNYNKAITREEFVKVMYNAIPAKEYEAINYIKMNEIPDYKVIDKYADEVYTFYNAGILTGTDRWGTFKPQNKITRAEVAAIVTRQAKLTDREYFTIK